MITTITAYFLLSLIVLFLSSKISYKLNLVDKPNKRKIHSKATAYTGGIAISIIFLVAIIFHFLYNYGFFGFIVLIQIIILFFIFKNLRKKQEIVKQIWKD